jgi:hypothetical protein
MSAREDEYGTRESYLLGVEGVSLTVGVVILSEKAREVLECSMLQGSSRESRLARVEMDPQMMDVDVLLMVMVWILWKFEALERPKSPPAFDGGGLKRMIEFWVRTD